MQTKQIDFSCKHDVMIRNEDGLCLPMDVPYFESESIAPGTWRLHSDGDAMYLVEGEKEAIVIDSGYGAGNLREYCQSLTGKPIRGIINTHDHFDHTANNAYFPRAYMTAATRPLATRPFPSFAGIDFPRDYPVEIVKNGDRIDLGGRTLEVIEIPDHAVGSIALLDSRERILFSGDEIIGGFKMVNTSLENVRDQFRRVWQRRDAFDVIWPGPGGACRPELVKKYLDSIEYLLAGGEGKPGMGFSVQEAKAQTTDENGHTVYRRFQARPCDIKVDQKAGQQYHVDQFGALLIYQPAR